MKLFSDVKRRSVFPRLMPRKRAMLLNQAKIAEWTCILREVIKVSVVVAIILQIWAARPYFVSAPQPFSASLPEALAFVTEEERRLEARLREVEQQIQSFERNIQETRRQAQSLRRDVSILDSQIRKLDLQIDATNLQVQRLTARIRNTQEAISESQLKIARQKESLAHTLQAIHETDQVSLLEMMLAGAAVTDFFDNVNAIHALQLRAQTNLDQIYALKQVLQEQESSLSETRGEQAALLLIQREQKAEAASSRRERNQLLAVTQGRESRYQELRRGAERDAAEIRARLLELTDVPEAPTLGQALELARGVAQQTGIRPAFLLAIITQESALGRNVGRCNLVNFENGESIHIRTRQRQERGMHPRRDVPLFLNITRELGRDPRQTLISCPMARGWGGAMGPAQFIPSTWANRRHIIEPFIQGAPNPWDIRHAFLASALYLRDLGGLENERRAALRYFAGGNWNNPSNAFYGTQVVRRINCLQTFIDQGTMSAACTNLIF